VTTPRFLADEDLRRSIVLAVRRLEPAVEFTTVQDVGLSTAEDADVLEFAQANRWLVVSHDVNTMKAAAEARVAAGLAMAGLFLVPQSRPTRPVAESLVLIWSASQAEEWQGRIVYLPV
jgi:Domain of unknown function (DUF5615)